MPLPSPKKKYNRFKKLKLGKRGKRKKWKKKAKRGKKGKLHTTAKPNVETEVDNKESVTE